MMITYSEIVTFELISLHTSIPHEFGLEAIDYFLTKYQEDLHPRFRKEFVLEPANFILKYNTLTFDSEFYLQIIGQQRVQFSHLPMQV